MVDVNKIWFPLAKLTGRSEAELGDLNNGELLGVLAEIALDTSLTTLGSTLAKAILGSLLLARGGSRLADEAGSHLFLTFLQLIKPAKLKEVAEQAKAFGASVSMKDLSGVASTLAKTPEEIIEEFKSALAELGVSGYTPPPSPPSAPPAKTEQLPEEIRRVRKVITYG